MTSNERFQNIKEKAHHLIAKLKETASSYLTKLKDQLKTVKPLDYIIIAFVLVIVLFALPPSRNFIFDNYAFYITDSFHPATDKEFFFKKAVTYDDQNKKNLSLRTFLRNIKQPILDNPYFAESLYNVGVIYYSRGEAILRTDKKKAIKLYGKAIGYWENFRAYYGNISIDSFRGKTADLSQVQAYVDSIRKKIKNIADAQTYIDSLDENPKTMQARLYKNEGQKAFYTNNIPLALELYKKALQSDPTYDTVYNNIGALYFYQAQDAIKKNNQNLAIQCFSNTVTYWEKAVLLDPKENNDLFLSLGGVYDQGLGNKEKAVYFYNEYIKRNPNDPQKNEIKKQISYLKSQFNK